jgi:hypothetical protein
MDVRRNRVSQLMIICREKGRTERCRKSRVIIFL